MAELIMTWLFNSLEKLSDSKRRAFFYAAFAVGGVLSVAGFAAFATPYKGWAFIVVVSGVFIIITTGILWDTMAPACSTNAANLTCPDAGPDQDASAPPRHFLDDDPPPDYDSVVVGGGAQTAAARRAVGSTDQPSSSKWSLQNAGWCPNFAVRSGGYDKAPTSDQTPFSRPDEPAATGASVVASAPPPYAASVAKPPPSAVGSDGGGGGSRSSNGVASRVHRTRSEQDPVDGGDVDLLDSGKCQRSLRPATSHVT